MRSARTRLPPVRPTRIATERLKLHQMHCDSCDGDVRPTRIATERLKQFIPHLKLQRLRVRPTRIATERLKLAGTVLVLVHNEGQTDPNRDRAIETLALRVGPKLIFVSDRPESRPSD